MALRYKSILQLKAEHTRLVTVVSFSPNGSYIASGGQDGKLSIWDVATGTLLHVLHGSKTLHSLCWIDSHRIFCGLDQGVVASAYINKVRLSRYLIN